MKSFFSRANMTWQKRPAIVRYIGKTNNGFTNGKEYEAFFVEYWGDVRNNLHVRDNSGEITNWNQFEEFEVISDEDNVLNLYEARVRCIAYKYKSPMLFELKYGSEYIAIGCDKHGNYLVKDESGLCYYYPPDYFEVVNDEHGILSHRTIYQ